MEEKSDNKISSSGEPIISYGDVPFSQFIYLCPIVWLQFLEEIFDTNIGGLGEIPYLPHFHGIIQENESYDDYYNYLYIYHRALPLFSCNNKEDFLVDDCAACNGGNMYGKIEYFCKICRHAYHKECVESPPEIKHSSHPKHSLKLYNVFSLFHCFLCGKIASNMVYCCTLCNFAMHPVCAMEPDSIILGQPKRHQHPLTLFIRKVSLDCNVCGWACEDLPTYVCLKCNFVAHRRCANFPSVIRISPHNHHITFSTTFPYREWTCGICGGKSDSEYGGYVCNKCDGYGVHSRCALQENIWDKKELEGVQEKDEIEENDESFKIISQGMILHFSHEHPLRAETNKAYDERKICQACIVPIYDGDFYSCMECGFILYSTCANAPLRKQHALHIHPLKLKVNNGYKDDGYFMCNACNSDNCGFIYKCEKGDCEYKLDVKCASISEPFNHQGHEHSLFLDFRPLKGTRMCDACKSYKSLEEALRCNECNFNICFSCVNLPQKARYKHDKHFLTLCFGGYKKSELDWCDICEKKLSLGRGEVFYMCNYGCNRFHVDCLLGKERYMNHGLTIKCFGREAQIIPNYTFSRPICDYCHRRCEYKVFFRRHGKIYCSKYEIH